MEAAGPGWAVLWALWALFFLVVEAAAILNRDRGDTLSEMVWRLFGVGDDSSWGLWRRRILLVGLAWAAAHFLTGGWV